MKRSLCISLCVLFAIVSSVNAEVINVTATRSVFDGTFDQVILRIDSFVGVPNSNYGLMGLLGSWDFGNAAVNLLGTTNHPWYVNLLNDYDCQDSDGGVAGVAPTMPQTWLNFSQRWPSDSPTRTGFVGGTLYHQFHEGFSGTIEGGGFNYYLLGPTDLTPGPGDVDGYGYGFDNTILAVLYVSKATTLATGQTIFAGDGNYWPYVGGGSYVSSTSVQIVPEPSTLALLCCGLLGLLAHARKRRK